MIAGEPRAEESVLAKKFIRFSEILPVSNIFITVNTLGLTYSFIFTVSYRSKKGLPLVRNGCGQNDAKAFLLVFCSNQETEKKHPYLSGHNLDGRGMLSNNQLYPRQRFWFCRNVPVRK